MTTDEALEELRRILDEVPDVIPVLRPNEMPSIGKCWEVVDAYDDTVIARGPTVAAAVEAAKKKLENQ